MKRLSLLSLAIAVVACAYLGVQLLISKPGNTIKPAAAQTALRSAPQNECQGYTSKTIIVSITKKHLWACQDAKSAYDSPVVTGDMNNAANLTPSGHYKIYAKETNRYLTGSDGKGSWNVHVNYWMPFLDNQYGTYGFHDATWRSESDFGHVDPYSVNASHGCVELPLGASAWLYDWAAVGTGVVVQA
jgi:lipoprotein-anchoring transpeptidase ErfK/SrfK